MDSKCVTHGLLELSGLWATVPWMMIFLITFTFSIELSHVIHLTTQGSKAHGDHLCPLIGEKHLSQLDPANAMCSCCAKSFSSEAASNCSSEI